ncbi:NucA/NucB deoxyribonuclease domain-containing protein [Paenibacillus sp. PDC88]|uniref:NucA/NucB deoxyribonuclease domain-containing protein n=1 Tax=Paenibacillus sp. PDC88 TaxID=1884375 RepID=UPI00089534DD|nr:NucA/NucB deoxyribonuclease domain-containing protein [Paenibacillus sp. PDC88]SDW68358.1 Deoxyribonuclease NucA/NucB [Paenibacillus sp. PDC88]
MKKLVQSAISVIIGLFILAGTLQYLGEDSLPYPASNDEDVVQLVFPANKYPETAEHIQAAIDEGLSHTCTIDRGGADENRQESLRGVPTKRGYDRDEWPMAMCAEGGEGASIEYIDPSDNRGAGSWVGNQLEEYPDGTRVEFIFN